MLTHVVAALQTVLAGIVDEPVPVAPPDQLGSFPRLIIYPQPGQWAFRAHGVGATGGAVVSAEHTIVIEWHTKLVDLAEAVTATTTVTDEITDRLFRAFEADRWDGTITLLRAVRGETFGELGWASDQTFGVRLLADITIYA